MQDLFSPAASDGHPPWERIVIGAQACVLRGFALRWQTDLLAGVAEITRQAPFRHLVTPGGRSMQVAAFLAHHGFAQVANIAGGIHAWALERDPSVPCY